VSARKLLAFVALVALAAGAARAQTFTYDAAGRMTQVTYEDGTTVSYTYDANGNATEAKTTAQPPGGGGGGGGGGCFIATAAFGSPLHPHVESLREFRDEHLLTNAPGRAFVGWYYDVSPPVAAFIAPRQWARAATRLALVPVVIGVEHPLAAAVAALALAAGAVAFVRR
jgi:YD repeat-containing protein